MTEGKSLIHKGEKQRTVIQAVQMKFKHQLLCVSWEINPQKYCWEPKKETEYLKNEQLTEKQESRTEKTLVLLLSRVTGRGVSWDFRIQIWVLGSFLFFVYSSSF